MAINKTVGGQVNSTDTILTTTVQLNNTTATKIIDALASDEPSHIRIYVDNPSAIDIIIKFQKASVDALTVGMTIEKFTGRTILELPNVYRGEISAIASANSPTITIIRG